MCNACESLVIHKDIAEKLEVKEKVVEEVIIDIEEKTPLISLMVETEPALIMNGEKLTPAERDKKRGELLRENI